jgi:hypothetical protein
MELVHEAHRCVLSQIDPNRMAEAETSSKATLTSFLRSGSDWLPLPP